MRIHFITSARPKAQQALKSLMTKYEHHPANESDVIVALGGDGTALSALHKVLEDPAYKNKKIYGLNCGSVGFLLNRYHEDNLPERIKAAKAEKIHPLVMTAIDIQDKITQFLAVNEVSVFRSSHQAAKIRIYVDDVVRMRELTADGIMLATPCGSTAYNLSAQGVILPIDANILALTPVSPFRPLRWSGAILNNTSKVRFEVLYPRRRPVNISADTQEIHHIKQVEIAMDFTRYAEILYDAHHSWNERILNEQFKH